MPKHYEPLHEDHGPRKLGESIEQLRPGSTALSTLVQRWAEVVGDALAAHVRPTKLAGGTLVIAVDDPAWATQLRYLESDLVARCNEALGAPAVTSTRTVVKAPGSL
jgi:predicted nucleic acid-binding Zn ribbon protein